MCIKTERRQNIVFCTIFLALSSLFQLHANEINGIVLDENSNPIPYTAIYTSSNNIGVMSDSLGRFTINQNLLAAHDTLIISSLGFETLKMESQKFENFLKNNDYKIYLKNKTIELGTITVTPNRAKKKENYGFADTKSSNIRLSGKPGSRLCVYIENTTSIVSIIKSINLKVSKYNNKNISLRIVFYTKTSEGFEVNNLVKKDIIISDFSKKNIRVDVSEYEIIFPTEGVYIGIEWISKSRNTINFSEKTGPNILCTTQNNSNSTWLFANEQWTQFPKKDDIKEIPKVLQKKILRANAQIGITVQ